MGPSVGWPAGRFRRRCRVVLAWVAALAIAIGLAPAPTASSAADYSAPARTPRRRRPARGAVPQPSRATRSTSSSGPTRSATDRGAAGCDSAARRARAEPHVAAVEDPYTTPGGISPDGQTLVAQLRLDVMNPGDMPVADTEKILAAAEAPTRPASRLRSAARRYRWPRRARSAPRPSDSPRPDDPADHVRHSRGGGPADPRRGRRPRRSAASLVGVVAAIIDVPDWSTSLATMMGIGIGIDYVLLMVTRFREWRAAGLDPEHAHRRHPGHGGRSVLVAGGTVVISMLGLFAMGLSFMHGAAAVTIVAVLVVMAAAVTLFPRCSASSAVGSIGCGCPSDAVARSHVAAGGHIEPSRGWVRWSRLIERNSVLATLAGVAVLVALALPFLGVRFGFPDAGNGPRARRPVRRTTRSGEGSATAPTDRCCWPPTSTHPGTPATWTGSLPTCRTTSGVAAVNPPLLNTAGDTAIMTVCRRPGRRTAATEELIARSATTSSPPRRTARRQRSTSVGSRRRQSTARQTSRAGCRC